jgi:hypothetical protein
VARKKEVEVYVNKEEVKYETRDLMWTIILVWIKRGFVVWFLNTRKDDYYMVYDLQHLG